MSSSKVAFSGPIQRQAWKLLRHAVLIFACALIVAIWFLALHLIKVEKDAAVREASHDVSNLATVFEQNVARSISEIDRVMQFMRLSHESSDIAATDWQALVRNRYAVNDQTLQVAVIDARGMLVATSIGALPDKPMDLSDREHFRVHRDRREDELFISRPVLGRRSGKWSVQLTRRLTEWNGAFNGVLVVSLDPGYLARAYHGLRLGKGSGLALVGTDDIVRSGTGIYAESLGRPLPAGDALGEALSLSGGTMIHSERADGATRIVARRLVPGLPLAVIVSSPRAELTAAWQRYKRNIFIVAGIASAVILLATIGSLRSRRRYEARMMQMARYDPLTRLANRGLFRDEFDRCLDMLDQGRGFALHFIDLDRFKSVNDTYGHPLGDKLLIAVADRLRANLRSSDVVARFGGDEFALLQPDVVSAKNAEVVAERLCRVLAMPYDIDGVRLDIGASIGVTVAPQDGCSAVDLMKSADLALYAAKSEGRRTWRFFHEEMNTTALARLELELHLRQAIALDQLELHYQPINAIDTGEVRGYEALVRWRHPERGMIPPMEFIPLAEETGLIVDIGAWVLRQACADMARLPLHLKVAVNFSPVQFKTPDLVETIRTTLAEAGVDPRRLEVEITESTLMQKDEVTMRLLEDLRALGVQLSMDDFGTGFSSLSYLQSYPINCIKIDRSFVKTLGESNSAAAIIRAITTLATSLGMTTIAEGVETRAQFEELALLGCTEAQGYYFSRPKPAAEILPLIGDDGAASDQVLDREPGSIAA